ncbi:MAG: molybdenum cofactor guanylyltransferase [Alphaproteobacteria bacterium]
MSIAGVVLAGGRSLRMEQNKALLSFEGQRLLDHMASLLESVHLPVYISGGDAQYSSFPDGIPFQGPLYGIYNCIQQLHKLAYTAALFVPVDMPLLTTRVLLTLIEEKNNYDAVYYSQYFLPLFVTFTSSVLDHVTNNFPYLNSGKSLRSFIQEKHSHQLQIDGFSRTVFTNVNTPEDWNRLVGCL